jgi:signal transduction histidine kinase
MKRYLDGLRLQLLGLVILPFSVILLATAIISVRIHMDAMRRLVAERDERSARAAAAAISQQLHHREAAIRGLALRLADGLPPDEVLDQAAYLAEDFDLGLSIFNLRGDLLASTAQRELLPDGLIGILDQETAFSVPFLDDQLGMVETIASRRGQWITAGSFSFSSLMRTATLGPMVDSQGYSAFLSDQQGRVLISVGAELSSDYLLNHPGVQAALRGETGSSYLPAEDGEHVVAFSPIGPTGWALIIEEPWETVASPILDLSLLAPLSLVPVLAVTLIALWFGSRQVVAPLTELEQKADQLAKGNYDAVDGSVGGIAEIQHLQETLTLMRDRIRAAQDALRGYINTMTRTQEDERRRLARDLHDETIQDLIALGQQIQMLSLELEESPATDKDGLRQLQTSTQEAIQRVRRLSRGLRPIYLEDLGLIPALEMLARDTEKELEIPIKVHAEGTIRRVDSEVELALYRIVQEALSNISRHAQAEHVWLDIQFREEGLQLNLRDDGVGFSSPEQLSDLAHNGHYGLIGINERAVLIDARLEIHSILGEGTRIVINLPYKTESTT